MSRKLLLGVTSVLAAGAALVAGPGTVAQATPQLPVLIGDLALETYATAGEPSTSQDRYVRMLPPLGITGRQWEFRDSTGGGTAIVHLDSGGCLQPDLTGTGRHLVVGGCLRAANESWDIGFDEYGTVFRHQETGACLTQPPGGDDGTGFDRRLTLDRCDGGKEQTFSLVW